MLLANCALLGLLQSSPVAKRRIERVRLAPPAVDGDEFRLEEHFGGQIEQRARRGDRDVHDAIGAVLAEYQRSMGGDQALGPELDRAAARCSGSEVGRRRSVRAVDRGIRAPQSRKNHRGSIAPATTVGDPRARRKPDSRRASGKPGAQNVPWSPMPAAVSLTTGTTCTGD